MEMEIRPANLADLNACLAIDDSFDTDYVYQMEERNTPGDIVVNFHLVRLPRPMKVPHIISRDELSLNFERDRSGAILVADDGAVRGFIDVEESVWNQVAYINNFAIAPAYRRKGVGKQLMRAVLEWARQKKLRVVMVDTSTKDYPAICFYQKFGFVFCGFNDQSYPNRDIAMLYAMSLR
jgi:ribosomal protein S18 acetylase RimI-like enzyme